MAGGARDTLDSIRQKSHGRRTVQALAMVFSALNGDATDRVAPARCCRSSDPLVEPAHAPLRTPLLSRFSTGPLCHAIARDFIDTIAGRMVLRASRSIAGSVHRAGARPVRCRALRCRIAACVPPTRPAPSLHALAEARDGGDALPVAGRMADVMDLRFSPGQEVFLKLVEPAVKYADGPVQSERRSTHGCGSVLRLDPSIPVFQLLPGCVRFPVESHPFRRNMAEPEGKRANGFRNGVFRAGSRN